MKDKIKFEVCVIECNADKFSTDYSDYIVNSNISDYGNMEFTLIAPIEVFEEVNNLKDECIEITFYTWNY